ncbi:hypothetical protein HNQ51_002513 [Inhella inkyongensis]|uniref:Secreted protein n=1 Tax=Inhella inkyongensis TaxID=392593 RepID=A0A840S8S4_9BURK|nr:hypothetical protein [Inhella inkyongensis]MBB5205194.1 hypothetical protein [Inhella inkyongensis]
MPQKKFTPSLILVAGLLSCIGLTACSSTQTTTVASGEGANEEKVICDRETPTGTNLPKTRCRTKAQIDAERRASQDLVQRIQERQSIESNKKIGD